MLLLHGSGKTAVLVERIINKVINEKVDIDKILIVTFTNAAASEMKERILDAIYKKIDENPDNIHLQKQITLLNKASICTIHSFCLDVIRNYFYEIDTSANFQIADTAELELLKQEVLDDLFEQKYIDKDKHFLKLIDIYATYRGDEPLKKLILKIYNQIQSNPFPKQWLEEKVELFNLESKLDDDFSKTIWGETLLNELEKEIIEAKIKLKKVRDKLKIYPELDKFSITISKDINQIENIQRNIQRKSDNLWEDIYNLAENLKFEKWPIDKKATIEYKEEAKQIRDKVKKAINKIIEKTFIYTSKEANIDINSMYNILVYLKNLVLEFEEKFSQSKKEKNKIDFHDIEHFALKILVNNNNGKVERTNIAKRIESKFVEIDIDEYQDSNLVQEYILKSISNGRNIFMVGDVKQSIYRFRQARPELFLEKYEKYDIIDNENESKNTGNENINGRKIKLFKNFRSRKEVLDFTNIVFKNIMSKELGDINYLQDEYLNLGADYPENANNADIAELHIINLKQEENVEDIDEEDNESEDIIEKNVTEAQFVANKIEKLIKNNFMIYDREKGYRKVEYKDIVILLRTTSNIAPIYERELINKNIPVFCDTSAEYLDSTEIQTILSLLKIIDNPLQDIPLITVLRSTIGNFTDNELIEIRLKDNSHYFYQSMKKGLVSLNQDLKNKIITFFENLKRWRQQEKQKSLDELIWQIYIDTNYYNYVGLLPNGNLRQANLKMLFDKAKQYETASFKGLYNFINFIDKLKTSSGDLSAAKIIGENDNVVRIMSIHKSKGLEFPIVFLSATGKQFNKQDLNQSILIHQDIGFGPKYINTTRNIEYQTLAKEAIKIKLEKEMISEEMRVLYVALTRAKEKLIITGTINDLNKLMKSQEETINIYEQQYKEKINERILQKYSSYLEWFTLISLKEKRNIENKLIIKVYNIDEVKSNKTKEEDEENRIKKLEKIKVDKLQIKEIREKLNWEYYFKNSLNIPTKTSVTEIKKEKQNQDIEDLNNVKYNSNLAEPNFTKEEKISSMRKGSLIHLCMQRLEINKDYTHNKLIEFIENLVNKNFITIEESKSININILDKYVNSNLWKELKNAKEIHKEEPFYIQIPVSDIYLDNRIDEKILVQGIIDLYYIDKDDNLILVDYKTDYVEDENILKEKYKEQLEIYKQALEQALNKKVNKVIIYSTYFREIEIDK